MAAKRYGLLIDTRRCIGCHACAVSCKTENDVPPGVFKNHVRFYEYGTYPNVRRRFMPVICNHCENAPCVTVCPTGASHKRGDGIVLVNRNTCIGCKYCMGACPYGARYLDPMEKVADKCTFCVHRVDAGITPSCVNTCLGRARIFGDLNDAESEIRQLVDSLPVTVLKPEKGTQPSVFYVDAQGSLAVGEAAGHPSQSRAQGENVLAEVGLEE